jgi:phenylpropionate dioxygenase-like ring-hydroxylating dioxygenase large terminal subunit
MTTMDLARNELDAAGEAALYRAMRRCWHPVCYASEVTDAPRGVVLLDERLVLVRLAGQVRCFPDLCLHRGTALSLGWVESDRLRCAYHGWTYDPEGVAVDIPARPELSGRLKVQLRRFQVEERGGLIWVCLGDDALFGLPEFPEWDDPDFRILTVPSYEWDASAARRIENYVDFSHFAWVHDGILGDREHPEVPDHEVWKEGSELRFGEGFFRPPHEQDAEAEQRAQDREGLPYKTGTILADKSYRLMMPYTVWLDQRLPGDRHYVLYFSASPVSAKRTRCFTFMARNYEKEPGNDGKFLEFNDLVVGQDRPIVESQRPEELPVDLTAELHVKGVDAISLEYRRWLVQIVRQAIEAERAS